MPEFKLTPEQENMIIPELVEAESCGNGAVFGQIGKFDKEGDIYCVAQFIDNEKAARIKMILAGK